MFLDAIVRRFPALKTLSEAASSLRLTGHLSAAVAQVEQEGQELTRAGRRFVAGVENGVTGQAVIQAPSAATAQWMLWNADTSRSYVIDQLSAFLVSGTTGPGATLLAAIVTAPAATMATKLVVQNLSNGGLSSKALFGTAVTITAPATGAVLWFPVAHSDCAATSTAICLLADNLKGRIILPPSTGLAISVLAGAGATPLFAASAMWTESELDLE